jgi:hypothetical protein
MWHLKDMSEIPSFSGRRFGLDVFGDEKISAEKVGIPLLRVVA